MIDLLYIQGKVVWTKNKTVVLESGNAGYLVNVADADAFAVNEELRVYLYKNISTNTVKQDISEEYFGFREYAQRELFALLVTVPGIGPRTALTALKHGTERLKTLIANRDVAGLRDLEGVRPNVAVNLVDHLAGKLVGSKDPGDLIISRTAQALRALGYRPDQIDYALKAIDPKAGELDVLVARSIKAIGTRRESEHVKT